MGEITKWTEHEDNLVSQIVSNWNVIVLNVENSTIKFGMVLTELLSSYPETTAKEIIRRVKLHPDLKPTISTDRIYQGWRLCKNRPELARMIAEYTPKKLLELPEKDRPILKRDGTVAVEHYLELYKRPGLIDEGMKIHLEEEAKKNKWTVQQLKDKINEVTVDLKEPQEKERIQKGELIRHIIMLLRTLDVAKLRGVKSFILELKEEEKD
jgi:hypothetical protein